MQLCVLSAISPYSGPLDFDGDDEDIGMTANYMAVEIVEVLGQNYSVPTVAKIVAESLISCSGSGWLLNYTGRKNPWDVADKTLCEPTDFYDTGVVIGPQRNGGQVELRRVLHFNDEFWQRVVVEDENGGEQLIGEITRYGGGPGGYGASFCWERPYRYFEEWMRLSCPPVALWDDETFAEQFYRLLDTEPDRQHSDSGLLRGISYGGIERSQVDGWQDLLVDARVGSVNTASAIGAGLRGKNLWSAFALDFGAWMVTRPDFWPERPLELIRSGPQFKSGAPCIFHGLPREVVVQILPLLPLADLRSVLLLSRAAFGLVDPLLDEVLWHHVHHGDFRWILPVSRVADEIDRANKAICGWHPKPAGLACALDSREFPFSRFIPVCLQTDSMRNRHRLWKIYKQYKALWEAMGLVI